MADGIKKISENVIKPGRALTLTNTNVVDYDGIPAGSLRTVPATGGLQYKITNNNWSKFIGEGILQFGTVTTNLLANKCVTNPKVADSAIDTRTLANNAVTTPKIVNLNITTEKLAQACVTTPKIADKAIIEVKIADSSISERTIITSAVTTSKIADRAIIESKIAKHAVTNYQLADNSVETRNILNKNITFEKIADGAVYGAKIPNSGIDHMHIRANAITNEKIADGAVTGGAGKIAAQTITSYNIKDKSLSTVNFADKCITGAKIADLAIGSGHIANDAITKVKLESSIRNVIDNAIMHDANGHVKIKKSLAVGANARSGYALSVDGDIIANKIYNAVYMDIAEAYIPGEDLEPGDIVAMGSDGKVYKADIFSKCIVGVVSDQYANCFGATPEELENKTKVAVGLIGKVPVKIKGYACIGQYVCLSDESGIGYATTDKRRVVGKVLENLNPECALDENKISEVLCLIYPN